MIENIKPEFFTIEDLLEWKNADILRVDPEYQRGEVWNRFQKRFFIDSVFRGYPIPAFYFHQITTAVTTKVMNLKRDSLFIVDGQQRINAIHDYHRGDFVLLDPQKDEDFRFPNFARDEECPWAGKRFNDLEKDLQETLLSQKVVVYRIITDNNNTVRDLFIRLQGGVPLNAQEKRDSWPGQFTEFVLVAGGKTGVERWHGWPFFKDALAGSETRRRQQVSTCFMLFYFNRHEQRFVDAKSKTIDDFYRQNIDFDNEGDEAIRFKDICEKLADIFDGHPKRLSSHYIIHLILFMDEVMDEVVGSRSLKVIPKALATFAERCEKATKAFEKNTKSEFADYHIHYGAYMTAGGSNNASIIQRRHAFFLKEMKKLAEFKFKDAERIFSTLDKRSAYYRDGRHCQVCRMKGKDLEIVPFEDAEFHHAVPHTEGGRTEIDNCATVHKDCHPLTDRDVAEFKEWWLAINQQEEQARQTHLLPPHGTKLRFARKSPKCEGIIEGELIRLNGHDDPYRSLSAAANAVGNFAHGVNGWDYWEIQLPDESEWVLASVWKDQE